MFLEEVWMWNRLESFWSSVVLGCFLHWISSISLQRSSHNFGPIRVPQGLKILQWPYIVWKQLNTYFAYAVALLLLSVSKGVRNMVLVKRDGSWIRFMSQQQSVLKLFNNSTSRSPCPDPVNSLSNLTSKSLCRSFTFQDTFRLKGR